MADRQRQQPEIIQMNRV